MSVETGGTERFKVENSTITTTVPVLLPADPTLPLQAATKEYVDTIASAGIHYHAPVRVESPINLSATYNNGTSGVGATLTNAGTQVALVIDGVTVAINDRVLIYTQTDQTQNGVYVVTNTGSGSTNWVLTRSSDTDTYGPSDPDGLGGGDAFFVQQGMTGAGELYVCNNSGAITFGTTNITFTQIAATAVYTAGSGLTLTGTVFSNAAPDQTVTLTQGGATTISGTYPNFTITSTDTTYSAGNGIGLAGTTFSVAAGSGLTQDATGLSHADTSSQASVDNTGATFVQDINLDGFGHVTGAASVTVTPSLIGAPQNDGTGATGTWNISISGNAANVNGTVAVANGGTGATTTGQARTNLDVPSTTGGGASGTWGINVTGNAATVSSITSGQVTTALGYTPVNKAGDSSIGTLQFTQGDGVRFGHTNQTDGNDGYIAAGRFASGLNIVGTQTTAGTGRQVRVWGSLISDGGVSYVQNSGTWSISISGNAATATSATTAASATTADQIDGIGFRNTGSNSGVNADTLDSNGVTYYTAGVPNFTGNATDGALYSQAYSSSWQHQIAGDYRSGQIALRGKNNGTWQSWRTVLDSANYTSYSPSLTGSGASGTWGINVSGNAATVTNGVYTTGAQTIAGEKTFSDNMVIRNTSPTINFRDTDNNVGFIHVNSNLMYVLRGSTDATTWTQVNGQWPFTFNLANNDANCGGSFTAVGNVTAYSDIRLKTDLAPIADAIEKVQSLTGYTYTRVDTGERHTGLIAQDVQNVLPEAVIDNGQNLSLAYGNMVGLLVEAIKAQQVQIDELKAKLGV
jgi:hypothetical protein